MKVSRQESLAQPFVLTGADLERLSLRLRNLANRISFEIECKDKLKREFATLQELLDFENPPSKEIQSLRIMASSEDLNTRIWLKLENDTARNIFVSIEGDESAALSANDSLEEIFSAIRPWYSRLSRTDFYLVLTIILMTPLLVLLLGMALGLVKINPNEPFSLQAALPGIVRGSLIGIAPLVFGAMLNRVKRTLFPIGVFAIGQGAKRHKDKEIIRTLVVVAFFVSLASSVLATSLFAFWR
ncbi:MAG: hypothetical protein QOF72_999 [Blastocatellia bacterium]|jgi:hypothetical protein|nr:hypothetical protein [Blastocatellia bacterium]